VSGLFVAIISGYLSLFFITVTSVLMFVKKRLARSRSATRDFVTKVHVLVAVLGGAFLVIHADYFIRVPLESLGIFLGYGSTAAAVVVWFTGFSFLERLRYSLLYHGSLSLFAISLMVIHAVILGPGLTPVLSEILLAIVVATSLVRAFQHATRILTSRSSGKVVSEGA
jgi:hypothetical protein